MTLKKVVTILLLLMQSEQEIITYKLLKISN